MKPDLSKYDNSWYHPGASLPKRMLWYVVNALFIQSQLIPFSFAKVLILRLFGAKIGRSVCIKPAVNVKYPWRLRIGDYVWIGEGVWIDNLADVSIGNNVCISQGAMLLCGNHNYKKVTFDLKTDPIVLKDGAWIGAQAIVCPGVTVGEGAVLSVGSVTAKDLKAYTINQGIPAMEIRNRNNKECGRESNPS